MANTRKTTPPKTRDAKITLAKPEEPLCVTFHGKKFRVAEKIGVWPLLQFARAAEGGESPINMRGLAAIHSLLQDCLHEDDWGAFQDHVMTEKVTDVDELMSVTQQVTNMLMERAEADAGAARQQTEANGQGKALEGTVIEAAPDYVVEE